MAFIPLTNHPRNRKLQTCIFILIALVTLVLYLRLFVTYATGSSVFHLIVAHETEAHSTVVKRTPHPQAVHERQWRRNVPKRTLYPLTVESPYVINNPNICTNVSNLKFLIIVHTSTDHFQRRRVTRETWANKNIFKTINLRIVFFFGLAKNKTTQELIENESIIYGDVVQGNFLDTYHNLTHKGVLAYRWTQDFCQQAEMIVKVDDDVFLNVFILLEKFYPEFKSKKRSMLCQCLRKNRSKIHRGQHKWSVDKHLFREYSHYPISYCMGYFVLISRDLIRPMYQASSLTPFFWVDDVYLYGLLPETVGGVKHQDIRKSLMKSAKWGLTCYLKSKKCSYLAVIAWAKERGYFDQLWYAALSQLSPAMKKEVNPLLLPEG